MNIPVCRSDDHCLDNYRSAGYACPMAVDVVHHVLLTLAAVIALGTLLARLFRYFGQPAVIGEVVAGIVLGPSLLGAVAPEAMQALVPPAEADPHARVPAALTAVSQLGIVFYMFLIGLELNAPALGRQWKTTVWVSLASIAVPFALGVGFAFAMPAEYAGPKQTPAGLPLFLGVAMAITAFPVLARILTDRGIQRTRVGTLALGCAAVGDVVAWCLLALAVGMAQANAAAFGSILAGTAGFLAAMFFVVRPILVRWLPRWEDRTHPLPAAAIPIVFLGVLVSAMVTEWIGIHAVFGAFVFGAVIPHESRVAHEFTAKLKDVVTVLLLPAFFALSGMRLNLGVLGTAEDWIVCLVVIALATLGKFGGTYLAARTTGQSRRDSAALGALMNTRGLMGLVVLDIGLELGLLGPKLYAMMVLMAVATTMMAGPMLTVFWKPPADETAAPP
jgi:Kef-type K+ transport system membrane component KefB